MLSDSPKLAPECYSRSRWIKLTLASLFLSCGVQPPAQSWHSEQTQEYEESLAAWTRRGERYENFEGRLFVTATLFSPAFTKAYQRRLEKRRELRQREREHQTERNRDTLRLFVAMNTTEQLWNDLRLKGGVFEATLFVDGRAIQPLKIERVALQTSTFLSLAFPYLSSLDQGYWLSFPAAEPQQHIALRISGDPASVTLRWEKRK
ncbi:MAG: hypothetical protein VYD19_11610 [Myxococcota bacterium]|nr:hypothetical protein [Myxococcota bacterium]